MSIVYTGGGTAGPLTTLLTVAKKVHGIDKKIPFHFIAPKGSIGKDMVEHDGIEWHEIRAVKFNRFITLKNILIPLRLIQAYRESLTLLASIDAKVVVTSGSYVSPPVVWAARALGVRIVVIQLDHKPGLANLLAKKSADKIYIAWEHLHEAFPNAEYVGLPTPDSIEMQSIPFEIPKDKKIVTVVGGGTGAAVLNELVWGSLEFLNDDVFVVHSTGKGKNKNDFKHKNYKQFEFNYEWFQSLLAQSDLVISRAGMGSVIDYIYHGSAAILIPIPRSHQEDNVNILKKHDAIIHWSQEELTSKIFATKIINTLSNTELLQSIRKNIHALYKKDAAHCIAKGIVSLYEK